jgi:hypothetical protein
MVFLLAFGFAVHASIRGVLGMALVCMVTPYVHPNQTFVSDVSCTRNLTLELTV